MHGNLTKLSDNKNALRTNNIEGDYSNAPSVGKSFTIFGEPLTKEADVRIITTSMVEEISAEEDHSITFRTLNSLYRLEN